MITLTIPGYKILIIENLVLDYNGTIACDGGLIDGVKELLNEISRDMAIHVLTADTFGTVRKQLEGVPCSVSVIKRDNQAEAKAQYVRKLGSDTAICIGNGRNDVIMLEEAALAVAVIQQEGAAAEVLLSADVVCHTIIDALKLIRNPLRLAATLRS